MKSIRAQQSPQRRPWPPTRVRQTIQTGGSSRSASEVSMPRTAEPTANPVAGTSEVRSASVIAIRDMIMRDSAMTEEETCAGA